MLIHVYARNFEMTGSLSQHIHRCLSQALDRFDAKIARVRVKLADVNGPKGGSDKRCAIEVRLPRTKPVLIEQTHEDAYAAVDQAAGRAKRAVRRRLTRMVHQRRRVR